MVKQHALEDLIWGLQTEEGEQQEEEEEGARSPTELLRKLIFYAQFHDTPEQFAAGPQDSWDYAMPGRMLQVSALASAPCDNVPLCEQRAKYAPAMPCA